MESVSTTSLRLAIVAGSAGQLRGAAAIARAIARLRERPDAVHVEGLLIHVGGQDEYVEAAATLPGLGLLAPAYHLRRQMRRSTAGQRLAETLVRVEEILISERPALVLIHAGTEGALMCALAAAKLALPVAHVGAGARPGHRGCLEDLDGPLTDRLSRLLFCASLDQVAALTREGISSGVELTGDPADDGRAAEQIVAAIIGRLSGTRS